jgi:hypothetical protein
MVGFRLRPVYPPDKSLIYPVHIKEFLIVLGVDRNGDFEFFYLTVFMGRFQFRCNFFFLGGVSILTKHLAGLKIKTCCLQCMVKGHKHLYITCQELVWPGFVM